MVGEAVGVMHCCCRGGRLLFAPFVEAMVEDEDAQREEKKDVADHVSSEDQGARSEDEAIKEIREGRVGGGNVKMNRVTGR